MAKVHDKFVIELAEVIKGYGNDPDVDDPFRLSEFYRFYELPEIAVSANHFKTMIPLEVVEKNAQPGWIPCSERLPEIKEHHISDTVICYCSNGAYAFSQLQENIFGQCGFGCERDDDYHGAVGEVVAWMPLPTPYREGGQE